MPSQKKVARDFTVLVSMLGIDENDLLDYLNWCLHEHLVHELSQDGQWLVSIKAEPDRLAKFKKKVEHRTGLVWDLEHLQKVYERVIQTTEKHYKQPITYEELLRLLINSPLKCANPKCGKSPPEVKLHIDHVFPASKGGSSKYENLRFLCAKCNLSKSDKLERTDLWLRLESLRPF